MNLEKLLKDRSWIKKVVAMEKADGSKSCDACPFYGYGCVSDLKRFLAAGGLKKVESFSTSKYPSQHFAYYNCVAALHRLDCGRRFAKI